MPLPSKVDRVRFLMPDPASTPGMGTMLWRLAPMIYGPTVLFALGEGAVVPLFPVIAAQLGADVPTAALIASALVVAARKSEQPESRTSTNSVFARRRFIASLGLSCRRPSPGATVRCVRVRWEWLRLRNEASYIRGEATSARLDRLGWCAG